MSFEFLFSSHVFHARTSLGLKQPFVADALGILFVNTKILSTAVSHLS